MKPILEVQHISKRYKINHSATGYLSLRERLQNGLKFRNKTTEDFFALKNVSFEVRPGESVGIIGRNGAGKSTLLKILSKITPPTKGRIVTRGRIASLLEVGTGFHPELSGRENIFFNGSLLGMKRKEIESKFDEIVEFSGVEKFLDTPLKHFSSGMQLRLAFAVAAFLEPEILVIDEVLAVGDAEFQKKCLAKMEDVTKSGRTILFVSHNMAAVQNLCNRGILLNQGIVFSEGAIDDAIRSYQSLFSSGQLMKYEGNATHESIHFQSIELDVKGVQPSLRAEIKLEFISNHGHKDAFLAFDITNSIGMVIMQAVPNPQPFISYSPLVRSVQVEIDLPPLIPDIYKVSVWIGSHHTETICWLKEVVGFEINASPTVGRNYPHSHNNGFIVPTSRILNGKTIH